MELCYLIRSIDRDDDLAFHVKDWAAAFQPASVTAEVIPGWGNLRLRILGTEVSFPNEMLGVQVCFEDADLSKEQAERIVQEMCNHASRVTQVPSEVIAL